MTVATEPAQDRQYAALVRAFPPRPIHGRRDYEATVAAINRLAARDERSLSDAEADYLDALSLFVEEYDRRHFAEPNLSPRERLAYLVEQAGLSASDLGRLLGNRGIGSQLLTGRRELSKNQIRMLVRRFKVDAGYFL